MRLARIKRRMIFQSVISASNSLSLSPSNISWAALIMLTTYRTDANELSCRFGVDLLEQSKSVRFKTLHRPARA